MAAAPDGLHRATNRFETLLRGSNKRFHPVPTPCAIFRGFPPSPDLEHAILRHWAPIHSKTLGPIPAGRIFPTFPTAATSALKGEALSPPASA